ncbi:MAG: DNA sulfur modification protein DndB [Limisphaerales bacterium]
MKVKFPAMQATIGQRIYYVCVMKLSAIPKMFTFTDWIEFTAEDREQRVLNKKRIPDIARYILDNEDGYLFSSITASYKCPVRFEPVNSDSLGFLEMDLEEANFIINDGQHRCAAIAQAIKENPALREEAISVLLFPYENKQRVQQMFSDLNRYVVKTAKSLDILFDQRDLLAKVTLEVCERVPAFQGMVDKDNVSLPARSEKMFTLSSLYDANQELLAEKRNSDDAFFNELVTTGIDYWITVSKFMPDWQRVRNGLRPIELRQENISTHSVVLRALGGLGAEVVKQFPTDWKNRLADLTAVDWSKKNREWENVCMVANSVVSNRQARLATKAYLKRKLGLPLTESEEKSIAHLTARDNPPKAETPFAAAGDSTGPLNTHDWDVLLIEVLRALGGRARKPDAEAEAYRRMKPVFDQHYKHLVGEGIPAWKKQFQWAWDRAKRQGNGELPEKVGQGIWQLTSVGLTTNAIAQN